MNTWYITTSENRESLIRDGITDAEFHSAGGHAVEVDRFSMEAQRIAGVHPQVLILDAIDPATAQAGISAMMRVRKLKQEKVRIVLLVPEDTVAGENIIEAAKKYNVRDVVPTSAEKLIGELTEVLKSPVDYEKFYSTWEEPEEESKGGFFGFGGKSKTKVKVVEKEVTKEVEKVVEVPVEVEKVVEKVKLVGTPTITLAGVQSRVGTTHLALSIAEYINSKLKLSCGLIIRKETYDFLAEYFEVEEVHNERYGTNAFKLGGILVVSEIVAGDISADVDSVVWDLGVFDAGSTEFKQGDVRLLVSGGAEWEMGPLNEIVDSLPLADLKDICAAFTLTPNALFEDYKEMMGEVANTIRVDVNLEWHNIADRKDLPVIAKMAGL